MRGDDQQSGHLFSYLSPEQRVPADHPLRVVRQMTDEALRQLSPQFEAIYAKTGRPSVPPEQLLRALVLQVLYTVRSEPYDDSAFSGRSDYQAFINNGIPSGGLFTGAEVVKTPQQQAIWGGVAGESFVCIGDHRRYRPAASFLAVMSTKLKYFCYG